MSVTIHNSAQSAAAYADTLGWTGCQFGEDAYATAGEAVTACYEAASRAVNLVRSQSPAHAACAMGFLAGSHSTGRFLCWPGPAGQVALEAW